MEVEITIFHSNCIVDKIESNFIVFMALHPMEDPSTATSRSRKFTKEDEDDKDELLGTYNVLLREYIKFENAKKKRL